MSTISEVESAIEQLPLPQVEELAVWLEAHRARRVAALNNATVAVEAWLTRARGAARPDATTAEIMALTRVCEIPARRGRKKFAAARLLHWRSSRSRGFDAGDT